MQLVNQHKKDMLNSVKMNVAHRNKAQSYRHGVSGTRALRCATFMDEKPSEFRETIEYIGLDNNTQYKRYALQDKIDVEVEDDSATMIEFRNHFEGRKKKAIQAERRKGTWIERYRAWIQRLREKYVDYDYE